ncbi:hypothetical protein [Streptomyces sp. NPDC003077]|uniref:hypothetical protein n=1 Tax=Streptomyces sp. NPDC003077 TaxID=3154443 RepID=UPI0033BDE67E
MNRPRTAALCASLLALPVLMTAPPAAAQQSPLLPLDSVRSVHPGDTLTIKARDDQADSGDLATSRAFHAAEPLRMKAPYLTATVAIGCAVRPGTYRVDLVAPWGRPENLGEPWAKVRVQPADESARAACRAKVKKLPPADPEETWPSGTPWPRTPWDVRTFQPGSRLLITDNENEGRGGLITLVSPAFANRPVLQGDKAVLTATATIKCDVKPGLYPVYQDQPTASPGYRHQLWARLRIPSTQGSTPATADCGPKTAHPASDDTSASPTRTVAWAAGGGGAALATTAGAFAWHRRRARRSGTDAVRQPGTDGP